MTLLEVFNAMDKADRPVGLSYDDYSGNFLQWGLTNRPVSQELAESAVCWAMVKALADAGWAPMILRDPVSTEVQVDDGRSFERPDALTALHAAYRAMKEAR